MQFAIYLKSQYGFVHLSKKKKRLQFEKQKFDGLMFEDEKK